MRSTCLLLVNWDIDQIFLLINETNNEICNSWPWFCHSPYEENIIPHLLKHLVLKTTLCDEGVFGNGHFKECSLGLKLLHLDKWILKLKTEKGISWKQFHVQSNLPRLQASLSWGLPQTDVHRETCSCRNRIWERKRVFGPDLHFALTSFLGTQLWPPSASHHNLPS